MSEIDVAGDADARIKQVFPDATDIDLSALTVTVDPTNYDPPVLNTKAPQQVWSETLTNCTRQTRREHVTKSFQTTTTWSVTLSATLKLGRTMSSAIRAIATVVLNSGFGVDISLTGTGSASKSDTQTKTIDEITDVAPCAMLTMMVMESAALYTVTFHIPVLVHGFITFTTIDPGALWSSHYQIRVPYSAHYTIDGKGMVTGSDLSVNWSEYRASCPAGTPCAGLSTMSDENFWKRGGSTDAPKNAAQSH